MFYRLLKLFIKLMSVPFAASIVSSTGLSVAGGRWWMPLFLFLVFIVLLWIIALLVFALIAAFRREGAKSVTFVLAVICALPLMFIGTCSGDYIHLALMSPYYLVEIHRTPDWRSKQFQFYWADQAIWALDGYQGKILIYDASGKTIVGERYDVSATCNSVYVRHLLGNFYLGDCAL